MRAIELIFAHRLSTRRMEAEPEVRSGPLRVCLAEGLLVIDEGGHCQILDFERRRSIWLDHEGRLRRERALHAGVHDRAAGMASAEHVLQVMRAGGVQIAGEPWQAESSYGLPSAHAEGPPVAIEQEASGGVLRWRMGGQPVASYVPAEVTLGRKAALRLYAHLVRCHPRIREALTRSGKVPAHLHTRTWFPLVDEEQTLELTSHQEIDLDLRALQEAYREAPPLDELQALLRRVTAAPVARLDHLGRARAALAAGRRVEALLAAMCHALVVAEMGEGAELTRAIVSSSWWFDPVRRLVKVLQRSEGPQGAPARVAVLDGLAAKAGDYAFALGIYKGEELLMMGKHEEARQALALALASDPNLAGAWVSAGRTYPGQLHFDETWACWDLAASLCPEHQIVSVVHEHRRALEQDYPDFF
jgi:tetratricopeptide (TPR) repeat protein